jgi:small subunit ribosomal protein S14
MKYLYIKDNKTRKAHLKQEKKRLILKYLLQNSKMNFVTKFYLNKKLEQMPKTTSLVRIRNRCTISNRVRSVNQQFKISRTPLRNLFLFGLVPGYKKAVW